MLIKSPVRVTTSGETLKVGNEEVLDTKEFSAEENPSVLNHGQEQPTKRKYPPISKIFTNVEKNGDLTIDFTHEVILLAESSESSLSRVLARRFYSYIYESIT